MDDFGGTYGIYLKLIKENRKISTCNWLDLETLGYQLILLKILQTLLCSNQSQKLGLWSIKIGLHLNHFSFQMV